MGNRAQDWLAQGERDLVLARTARMGASFEWACFAAQQAAEKAVKALIIGHGGAPWGHSILGLVGALPPQVTASDQLRDAARALDKLYIPTRYPDGFDQGKPADYFTDQDAATAIHQAEFVIDFCRGYLSRP
jgi:HEPN domain-containing protein